jgi:cytochrome c553
MTRLARSNRPNRTVLLASHLALASSLLASCQNSSQSEGERLARTYCAACHAFPEPQLLAKQSWQAEVLPQMAPRLGVGTASLFDATSRSPHMEVLPEAISEQEWRRIVAYYLELAPDTLPPQALPAEPRVDPDFFTVGALAPRLQTSAIITLLRFDSTTGRIFVGEAGSNRLHILDTSRRPISSLTLGSPPTDLIVEGGSVLVLESGILDPNDEPKGALVRYDFPGADSLRSPRVLIDSLFRPVFVRAFDFDGDRVNEFVICEYGNNRGRLALYRNRGSRYERQVLHALPGAIRFEIRDMTSDDAPDIVALFAQGDERIVLFENDGRGTFSSRPRVLARFPPVYGSMYFSMHDFNGDNSPDIVYVNGDNFDYSRVLKPYHGIRILENDRKNNFHERFFFPVYGAARAEVADFDRDGDLDVVTTSNFADFESHPERGIMFLVNDGSYQFRPFGFTGSSGNQWNLTAAGDLNKDGWPDVIVGAMNLENIARLQRRRTGGADNGTDALLLLENRMHASQTKE